MKGMKFLNDFMPLNFSFNKAVRKPP